MPTITMRKERHDADGRKGATEDGVVPVSYTGQLPHRLQIDFIKDSDTDFPEPGCSPEHSGQHGTPEPKS